MATITFDTHKFVRTLKNAEMPENQAEEFKATQGKAELATQRDIVDVRRDIDDLYRDMDARCIQLEQHLIIKKLS